LRSTRPCADAFRLPSPKNCREPLPPPGNSDSQSSGLNRQGSAASLTTESGAEAGKAGDADAKKQDKDKAQKAKEQKERNDAFMNQFMFQLKTKKGNSAVIHDGDYAGRPLEMYVSATDRSDVPTHSFLLGPQKGPKGRRARVVIILREFLKLPSP
jgi:hypothetical protein